MIVASSADVGKSETIVQLAEDLTVFVRQAVEGGLSLDGLERGVFKRALEIGKSAVDFFLDAQGDGDLGDSVTTAEGTVLYRSDTVQERPLRTIFGEQAMQTYVYSQGEKRKIELRPIDARINLPEGKASYLLQEFSQLFCVEKAFHVGARQVETVLRQKLSVAVLEDINRAMGEQADVYLEHLPTPPRAEEGALLVATADGKGVPLVQEDAQQVPTFDKKERPGVPLFPVQPDPEFGFCLHPADLATNKALALAGRAEIRDLIDILFLHDTYLSLGAVCWAACGKDQGYSPRSLLDFAKRNMKFRAEDLARENLAQPIDLPRLKHAWCAAVAQAEELIAHLPLAEAGCLFLTPAFVPFTPDPAHSDFGAAIRHYGSIRGAWPTLA